MFTQNDTLLAFTQQFANMTKAGIPLSRILFALGSQEENLKFKKILNKIRIDVEGGGVLSEAFSLHPKIFSPFYINMINAGEKGAGLTLAMTNIAEYLEKDTYLKNKLKSVFMYPLVILGVVSLIIVFLLLVVAPVFVKVYGQMGIILPMPTRVLLFSSVFLKKYSLIAIVLIAIIGYVSKKILKKEENKKKLENFILNIPIIGMFVRKVYIARFTRTLANMLTCQITLVHSLIIAGDVSNSFKLKDIVNKIILDLEAGEMVSKAFSESTWFPPILIQMISAGEETGQLGDLLMQASNTLDNDVENSSKKLVTLLEPSLTFILAGLVGFIALAIYLPMFDLMRSVGY